MAYAIQTSVRVLRVFTTSAVMLFVACSVPLGDDSSIDPPDQPQVFRVQARDDLVGGRHSLHQPARHHPVGLLPQDITALDQPCCAK